MKQSRPQRAGPMSVIAAGLALGGCDQAPREAPTAAAPAPAWDVTAARGETREIDFTTDTGTWMSVDVSPDGEWLAFDLLAHIYRVPASGGEAVCLTRDSGVALNFHPRISPDGTRIAFVSDRAGHNNLWIMDADGGNPRLVHPEPEKRVTQPVWEADGRHLLAQRIYNGNRWVSEGIWRYPAAGGAPVNLVPAVAGSPTTSGPEAVFYHAYSAEDPKEISHSDHTIHRLDVATGASTRIGAAGIFSPRVSPDGKRLAFVRRHGKGTTSFDGAEHGPPTTLWIRDLESGDERLLLDGLDPDIAETAGDLQQQSQLVSGYAWTKDGAHIVLSHSGKLTRVAVDGGELTRIPFRARVHRRMSERAETRTRIESGPITSRFLRWARTSPDGATLAFQAFGRIWLQDARSAEAAPHRLTDEAFSPFEYSPVWSPDGRWIAFTAWDHENRGAVWKAEVATGERVRLAAGGREFLNLDWSPDGERLVLATGSVDPAQGEALAYLPAIDVATLDAGEGGELRPVVSLSRLSRTRAIVSPAFDAAGRIYFTRDVASDRGPMSEIRSVDGAGGDERHHATVPYAETAAPSPDGSRFAIKSGTETYLLETGGRDFTEVVDLPYTGGELDGVRRISRLGGLYPHWIDNGVVEFVSADIVYRYDVEARALEESHIRVTLPRRTGSGVVALKGARVITLEEPPVLERADIVVTDDRISCVGRCDTANADHVVDATGMTVMPGIIDTHNSPSAALDLITPARPSDMVSDLAHGVTTAFVTSMWSEFTFPLAELVETGEVTGPRVFSATDKFRWDRGPFYVDTSSYEVVEEQVRKTARWGGVAIKQYLRERDRAARQQVAAAARENGIAVTAHEVKGLYEYSIALALDGYTATQHTPANMPLRSDAAEFFARAKLVRNATIGLGGGFTTHQYYLQRPQIWTDDKTRRYFTPHHWARIAEFAGKPLRPKTDYGFELHAQAMARIVERGGYVTVASHGEFPGLSPHLEIWILADAMGPLNALRSASLHGAYFLGADDELGSVEQGKVADLVVLRSNPLEDIRNTRDVAYVMKAGRLFDGDTLDELWPEKRRHPPPPWATEQAVASRPAAHRPHFPNEDRLRRRASLSRDYEPDR